ncbi:MAG: hypothetical protein J7549_13415 [Variovorax sp.]|nr:hypothetical protein [Variovorax sp.]
MAQQIVVALIVALAALYAVWRWMPGSWRRAMAAKVAAGSERAGLVDAQQARQLAASLGKTSGCGSCDSCGSCSTPGGKGVDAGKASAPRAH